MVNKCIYEKVSTVPRQFRLVEHDAGWSHEFATFKVLQTNKTGFYIAGIKGPCDPGASNSLS